MNRKMGRIKAIIDVVPFVLCFAVVFLINCGTPMGPVDSQWRSVISLGEYNCNDLQCDTAGDVYIAAGNRILRYNGTEFEMFAEFDGYREVDMFTFDGGGAACLDCDFDPETAPGLFRYSEGLWEQIVLPDDIDEIIDFEVVNADSCWVYGFMADWDSKLYLYSGDEWTGYDFADYIIDTEVTTSGTFYAIPEVSPYSLHICTDNGNRWTEEPFVFADPQFEMVEIGGSAWGTKGAVVSLGDTLYIIARIKVNGAPDYSLIKRDGNPGDGLWTPVVICPERAPDTHIFESVAFDGTGRGLIAGEETSIVSDGKGVWTKELFDHKLQNLRGSPTGGFWAICRDKLYYHP
ncbi:MAG: hypothetical protein JSW52_08755 [Candidatus Coatesbacteria bacterium]|nr:MAG: hypothetical protein JSW52_08755 [Candidatus Coatesbacteria bacterium]